MEIKKSTIVNTLYILSFTFFGIGNYVTKTVNFSVGNTLGILPLLAIASFYVVDLIFKKEFNVKLTLLYLFLLIFIALCIKSFFVAYWNGHPGFNNINTYSLSIYIFFISHTALIVHFYNSEDHEFSISDLLFWGLSLFLVINLLGYFAGMRNQGHNITGRINLPFSLGIYDTANTVAILNLLIIGKWMGKYRNESNLLLIIYFVVNLVLMLGFNSRLSILIFLVISLFSLIGLLKRYNILYFLAFFTIPLLLGFADLIFRILQLPVINNLVKRATYDDVTGFNGRREIWQKGIDWFLNQGTGFLWGNGYSGHFYIGLLDDLSEFWHKSSSLTFHMHSSALEYLLSIGILGLLPFLILIYQCILFIVKQNRLGHKDGIMLGVVFYLLFLLQIDNYVYVLNMGFLIIFSIISSVILKKRIDLKSTPVPINLEDKIRTGNLEKILNK